MLKISTNKAIITSINGLNSPIEKFRSNTLPTRDKYTKNREQGWKKISQANRSQRKAGESISISDNIKCQVKKKSKETEMGAIC